MPDDKKKQLQKLQALAAKRKADNESGGVGQKKLKSAAAATNVIPPKKLDLHNGDKKKLLPRQSAISKGKETKQHTKLKAKSSVERQQPDVVKLDSDEDDDEDDDGDAADTSEEDDEDDGSAGSEDDDDEEASDEDADDGPHSGKSSGKKIAAAAAAAKPPPAKKFKPSDFKEKDTGKSRVEAGKDNKGKGKKAVEESDDNNNKNDDEDDGGDLSDDPLDEVDPSNILPSRTRRRASQPVQYDFGNGSGDDDEDDSDA